MTDPITTLRSLRAAALNIDNGAYFDREPSKAALAQLRAAIDDANAVLTALDAATPREKQIAERGGIEKEMADCYQHAATPSPSEPIEEAACPKCGRLMEHRCSWVCVGICPSCDNLAATPSPSEAEATFTKAIRWLRGYAYTMKGGDFAQARQLEDFIAREYLPALEKLRSSEPAVTEEMVKRAMSAFRRSTYGDPSVEKAMRAALLAVHPNAKGQHGRGVRTRTAPARPRRQDKMRRELWD